MKLPFNFRLSRSRPAAEQHRAKKSAAGLILGAVASYGAIKYGKLFDLPGGNMDFEEPRQPPAAVLIAIPALTSQQRRL